VRPMTGRERRLIAALEPLSVHIEKGKATKLKDVINGLGSEVLELVTCHGKLVRAYRESPEPTLDLDAFIACAQAMGLCAGDLDSGFRPCIVSAGQRRPRYCFVRPNGKLHMGPNVPK